MASVVARTVRWNQSGLFAPPSTSTGTVILASSSTGTPWSPVRARSYGRVCARACRPGHIGEFSIVGSISAGAPITSVIQYLTASARRPAATSAVIRPDGSSATSRVPGITNGAS
jgi:hypothetical protein